MPARYPGSLLSSASNSYSNLSGSPLTLAWYGGVVRMYAIQVTLATYALIVRVELCDSVWIFTLTNNTIMPLIDLGERVLTS